MCLALRDSELRPRCLFVSASLVFKLGNTVLGLGVSFEGAGNLPPLLLGGTCTWSQGVPSRGCIHLEWGEGFGDFVKLESEVGPCVDLKPGEPVGACTWGLRPLELEDCQALSTDKNLCLGWPFPAS